jgi:hypothetical protein
MKTSSKLSTSLFALAFVSVCSLSASAQQFASPATRATTIRPSASTISTLYANDPIAHALCFADGKEGGIIQDGAVFNRCSHIDFDNYKAGYLSVGIEGGEIGRIIDVGTADELRNEYGYRETVGKGQGFASIAFQDGKILILKDGNKEARQELRETAQLFENNQSGAAAEAKAGHIYLARITDRHKKDFQILVKLLVLNARPGELVTFRWELL